MITKEFGLYFFLLALYMTLTYHYFFSKKLKKEMDIDKKKLLKRSENYIYLMIFLEAIILIFFALSIYGNAIILKLGIN